MTRRLAPRAVTVSAGAPPALQLSALPRSRAGRRLLGRGLGARGGGRVRRARPDPLLGDAPVAGADVVYRLVGGSFAAFGLIAWQRRPDSRSGPLMTATGSGLLVSLLLKQIHAGVALTAGEVLEDIWAPAFIALVLSFVTGGRLTSRLDRLIVAGIFVSAFVLDVVSMLFSEQPDNVLLVLRERRRSSAPSTARSAAWTSRSASPPCR